MVFLYLLFCWYGDGKLGKTVTLSSDDNSRLFYSSWFFETRFYRDGVYVVLNGSTRNKEGLCIYHWTETTFERIFCTTPREGIYSARAVAVTATGDAIYLSDWLAGLIYRYIPGQDFKRIDQKFGTESLVVFGDAVIRGGKKPSNNLGTVAPAELAVLEKINDSLPRDATHPSEGRSNENEMLLALDGSRLAIGYKLHENILIVDMGTGAVLKEVAMKRPFPGYVIPPDDFVGETKNTQEFVRLIDHWLETFHKLEMLSWHRGELFGFFRRGYEDNGIWARLDGQKPYFWDNNKGGLQLLSIGPDRVILGEKEETADEAVIWTLRQSSSLPSY